MNKTSIRESITKHFRVEPSDNWKECYWNQVGIVDDVLFIDDHHAFYHVKFTDELVGCFNIKSKGYQIYV